MNRDRLDNILTRMCTVREIKGRWGPPSDEEDWHEAADHQLIRLIHLLAEDQPPEVRTAIAQILAQYHELPKWYA